MEKFNSLDQKNMENNSKQFIPLESLVIKEKLEEVDAFNETSPMPTTGTEIRGMHFDFYTPNRRCLWQSVGQEHIEPDLLDFIDEIPAGETLLDLGASIGNFAIYAAAKKIKVYAIEPDIMNYHLLALNNGLNREYTENRILSANVAASDKTEINEFTFRELSYGSHNKHVTKTSLNKKEKHSCRVMSFKMDDVFGLFNWEIPNHIKIDVDGSEVNAIKGMENLLSNDALKRVFIELSVKSDEYSESLDLLEKHGFQEEKRKGVQNYKGLYNIILNK